MWVRNEELEGKFQIIREQVSQETCGERLRSLWSLARPALQIHSLYPLWHTSQSEVQKNWAFIYCCPILHAVACDRYPSIRVEQTYWHTQNEKKAKIQCSGEQLRRLAAKAAILLRAKVEVTFSCLLPLTATFTILNFV